MAHLNADGTEMHQDDVKSIVRSNMMQDVNYRGYCGNNSCKVMPRTIRHVDQNKCPSCGWVSQYPDDFVARYKLVHKLK